MYHTMVCLSNLCKVEKRKKSVTIVSNLLHLLLTFLASLKDAATMKVSSFFHLIILLLLQVSICFYTIFSICTTSKSRVPSLPQVLQHSSHAIGAFTNSIDYVKLKKMTE